MRYDSKAARFRRPNAVWAWEFLRRNETYQSEFLKAQSDLPERTVLAGGSHLLIGEDRYQAARQWGLLFYADPRLPAYRAGVFWKPSIFSGTIPVTLRDAARENQRERYDKMPMCDRVVLSKLWCDRMIFESINRSRHIVLAPRLFWIQLYCDSTYPIDDNAIISFRIDGAYHAEKQIKSVQQLLKLHRSSGRKLSSIGIRRKSNHLAKSLKALDVQMLGGSYKDIARALYGDARVRAEWSGGHSPLKQKARRALERGRNYRDGKYLELLT